MKNKFLLFGIVGLTLLAAVGYYLFSKLGSTSDLAKHIPKDAIFVCKVDLPSLGKKINVKELKELKIFKDLVKASKEKGSTKIMDNPLSTGYSVLQSPYIFMINASKDDIKPVVCMILGVADKSNFIKTLKELSENDIRIKEKDGYAHIEMGRSGEAFINEKFMLVMSSVDSDIDISYLDMYKRIYGLSKEDNITSLKNYQVAEQNESDVSIFFNKPEFTKFVTNKVINQNKSDKETVQKAFDFFPISAGLVFKEDAIQIKTIADPDTKENIKWYNEDGYNSSDLKKFAPDGKPLAYMCSNFNFTPFFEILEKQDDFNRTVEDFTKTIGISKSDLFNMFNGKSIISLTGIKDGAGAEDSDPQILVSMGIKDMNAFDKLYSFALTNNTPAGNDIYSLKNTRNKIEFTKTNDALFISNNHNLLMGKKGANAWSELKEDCGKSMLEKNSLVVYLDLKYKTYAPIINREVQTRQELEIVETFFDNLKSLNGYANKNEAVVELKMKPKNLNSLWYLMTIANDIYKKVR